MEGKIVVLSVLIMSLVMAQTQVEAKVCCPTKGSRRFYEVCILDHNPNLKDYCVNFASCKNVKGTDCPPGYAKDILENSGDAVDEFCKLGCESSVCGALTTLQNSDASEIVNGAVAQCTKACSKVCTKGSANAVKTA